MCHSTIFLCLKAVYAVDYVITLSKFSDVLCQAPKQSEGMHYKTIYEQQVPVGQLNKKWWPYITKRPQGQFARTFHQLEHVRTMGYSGSFYQTNPEAS